MTLLTYAEALIWLESNVIQSVASQMTLDDLEDEIEKRAVWFEQDALPALRDFRAGTPGKNDPGSQNNTCLGRRPRRR